MPATTDDKRAVRFLAALLPATEGTTPGVLPEWNEAGPNVIRDREILYPGTFNGAVWDRDRVARILVNTQIMELGNYEPGLYIAHDRGQGDMASGWWRNWRPTARGGIMGDLEIVDRWTWDAIRMRQRRYVSLELSGNSPHPETGDELGESILSVALIDAPAVRTATLFRAGEEPVNLADYPELQAGARPDEDDRGTAPHKTGGMKMFEGLKRALGLGADADEPAVEQAVATLRAKADATKPTEPATPAPTTPPEPVPGTTELRADPQVTALQARLEAAETQLRAAETLRHREGIETGLAALRTEGKLPPVVCERLGAVLTAIPAGTTIKLRAGEVETDVALGAEIIAALREMPVLVHTRPTATAPAEGTASLVDQIVAQIKTEA